MKNTIVSKRFIGFAALITVFVVLFFRGSSPGLNWLIYTAIAAIIATITVDKAQRHHIIVPAVGLAVCGIAVFMHSDALAITMCILSFGYLGVALVMPRVDPGFGALAGFMNFIISPFGVIIRFFQRINGGNGKFKGMVTMLLIPGALLTFFSILYYQSSPAFKQLLDTIRWDHFPEFIFTAILGLFTASVLLYCFAPIKLNKMYDNIANKSTVVSDYMGNKTFVKSWLLGVWSVVGLLLVVTISDFTYQIKGEMPADFSYSSYLHQGIYASIFSIICSAVLTVLTTNYLGDERKASFRIANYIFIALNGVFIWQNVLRNYTYISEYGLTEKRLILYVYLTLCLIGLVLTIITIAQNKSLGFLYKFNAFNVYFVLTVSAVLNWSTIITSYNLEHPYGSHQLIDYDYLLSLDKSNTYLLEPHTNKMRDDLQERMQYRQSSVMNYDVYDYREWVLGKSRSKERLQAQVNTK
ncbi:MAG: hypothetical protein ACI9JN_002212 [Bacteroidia bacterium]|jgi:hypothetical protein